MDVKIDMDFVETPDNDEMINAIAARLYYLTRKKMMVPYKINDRGITMIMCNEDDICVCDEDNLD